MCTRLIGVTPGINVGFRPPQRGQARARAQRVDPRPQLQEVNRSHRRHAALDRMVREHRQRRLVHRHPLTCHQQSAHPRTAGVGRQRVGHHPRAMPAAPLVTVRNPDSLAAVHAQLGPSSPQARRSRPATARPDATASPHTRTAPRPSPVNRAPLAAVDRRHLVRVGGARIDTAVEIAQAADTCRHRLHRFAVDRVAHRR